ncbi:transglycosylase family protein [Streptomyces sp. NPDC006368]|uniref:transglycosylase family protein n=1 Tax=Streptomyces sp. NPDC006368 TaxID=3156760 RepID=UPI0033A52051
MTGSALALPLLGAGSASAVDAGTWDRVAECESGGAWSADMGNGFYGGLQISQETWDAYGGTQYALRPDLASRAQQIAVAEKVHAATGVKAWETCAPIAGLGGAADAPEADAAPDTPSTPAAPDPALPVEPSDPAVRPADPVESLLPTDPAGAAPATPAPSGDTPSGAGKHRGEPAKDERPTGDATTDPAAGPTAGASVDPTADPAAGPAAPNGENATSADNSVTEREMVRHASRGDGTTRDPAAVADAAEADGAYTVRPGDNLSVIADAHELPGGWTALYDANREAVGDDPDLILPGQRLDLDAARG